MIVPVAIALSFVTTIACIAVVPAVTAPNASGDGAALTPSGAIAVPLRPAFVVPVVDATVIPALFAPVVVGLKATSTVHVPAVGSACPSHVSAMTVNCAGLVPASVVLSVPVGAGALFVSVNRCDAEVTVSSVLGNVSDVGLI